VFLGSANRSAARRQPAENARGCGWGSHGAGSPQVWRGASAVHGELAALCAQRLEGALTGKSKGMETTRERARLRFISRWVGHVFVVGVHGDAPLLALPRLRRGDRYGSPVDANGPSAAARRRQRGARLPPNRLHSPSPLWRHTLEEGKTPGRLDWRGGLGPESCRCTVKQCRGKDASAP
jgi:hypothetical protein